MSKSIWGLVLIAVTALGCGSADSTTAPPVAKAKTSTSPAPSDPIAQVAYQFFDAVLTSNRDAARQQLTPLAVRRMNELGLDFLLPLSESSKFSIGTTEVIDEHMAAVDSIVTEVDASGQTIREKITVVLRMDQGRWGVMGVVTGMGANEQLDGFNFEKPDQPFSASSFDPETTTNIASGSTQQNSIPQQAARPQAQDPFRQ